MLRWNRALLLCAVWAGTLAAQSSPVATKTFSPAYVRVGDVFTITITLTNPNAGATLTNVLVTDTVPPGAFSLVGFPASQPVLCNTRFFTPANGMITIGQSPMAPGTSCGLAVSFRANSIGTFVNTTSPVSSAEAPPGAPATATLVVGNTLDTPTQTAYFANLNVGESYINLTNDGANGAPLLGPGFGGAAGNICVNVYALSPDEQLISCCSCLVTPNGLASLGVNRDLTVKTLTGVIPTSIVVRAVATLAGTGGSGTSCSNSAATATTETVVSGMLAWATTIHNAPPGAPGYTATESPFLATTLNAGELGSLAGRCAAILGNGSGFGICRGCQAGALGASRN